MADGRPVETAADRLTVAAWQPRPLGSPRSLHGRRLTGGVSRANRPLTAPVSKAHLVESEVADRLVMHCGREMHYRPDRPWEFTDEQPDDACEQCR